MPLNLPFNYFVLQKLICQDKYKKIELKLKHKNARSANIANIVYYGKTRISKVRNLKLHDTHVTLLFHEVNISLNLAPSVRLGFFQSIADHQLN